LPVKSEAVLADGVQPGEKRGGQRRATFGRWQSRWIRQ